MRTRRRRDVSPGAAVAEVGFAPNGGWFGPRRQMVAIGLAGTVLHLILVGTALSALREVNTAHDEVERITAAQADFQEADMVHDEMRADVLLLLLPNSGVRTSEVIAALDAEVVEFRALLHRVDAVQLPDVVATHVGHVRPLQERYARDVSRMTRAAETDPALVAAMLPDLLAQFRALAEEQSAVTVEMSAEADRREDAASEAERAVALRVAGSAVVALTGTLGLTLLLRRLGGALAESLAQQRDVAETLQHSLLPERLPKVPGVRLAARYLPGAVGTEVGGDWYDVISLPSGEIGIVMGDVVGHDLRAAANMGQLRNALRACAAEGAAPEEVLQRLNRLCIQQDMGGMATVVYGVLNPVLGTLRMANAGHYPPLLVSGPDRRFLESRPYPPLGAVRDVPYARTEHELPSGSLLVLYTDGLVERRGEGVEEGMARLRDLVAAPSPGEDLEVLCDALLLGMLLGRAPQDDVALLAVASQDILGCHLDITLPAQADQLAVLRGTLERWLTEAGATDQEVFEITVACSEATTNAIEHAYGPGRADVQVSCDVDDGCVTLTVRDWGQWREARGRDRGRGLQLIHGLMDQAKVSHGSSGTVVVMSRRLDQPL